MRTPLPGENLAVRDRFATSTLTSTRVSGERSDPQQKSNATDMVYRPGSLAGVKPLRQVPDSMFINPQKAQLRRASQSRIPAPTNIQWRTRPTIYR